MTFECIDEVFLELLAQHGSLPLYDCSVLRMVFGQIGKLKDATQWNVITEVPLGGN